MPHRRPTSQIPLRESSNMKRFKFSWTLRSIFLLVTAISLLFVLISNRVTRQRNAVRKLGDLGCSISYGEDGYPRGWEKTMDWFRNAQRVHCSYAAFSHMGPVELEIISQLKKLPRLQKVVVSEHISDSTISFLRKELAGCKIEKPPESDLSFSIGITGH